MGTKTKGSGELLVFLLISMSLQRLSFTTSALVTRQQREMKDNIGAYCSMQDILDMASQCVYNMESTEASMEKPSNSNEDKTSPLNADKKKKVLASAKGAGKGPKSTPNSASTPAVSSLVEG